MKGIIYLKDISVNGMKPEIAIVVAMDEERGIGRDGKLPWHIPEDLRRFRSLTVPYPVIMGRKTFESILASLKTPLPQRPNIVISRNPGFSYEGVEVELSLEEAIKSALRYSQKKIFIIGGAQVFSQSLRLADRLCLTLVEGKYGTDVFFPDYHEFSQVISERTGCSNGYNYSFVELVRDL